jgi:hypothetical protein
MSDEVKSDNEKHSNYWKYIIVIVVVVIHHHNYRDHHRHYRHHLLYLRLLNGTYNPIPFFVLVFYTFRCVTSKHCCVLYIY